MALDVQGTDYLKLPVGTTGQRPSVPASGMIRINTTTGNPEWWDATSLTWLQFSQQSVNSVNTFNFKNRIINGAMQIDQRNAGASVTPTDNAYTLDHWINKLTQASKYSVQQNAGSITPPVGFTNYLGITSLSAYSVLTGDTFSASQAIEGLNISDLGWGTANAKTITLSFQVYSSLTGTFGGVFGNNAGNRSYPFSYSIPVANTWTTISVTVAGNTTGTWLTTNGIGIIVRFGLGSGSTYTSTAGAWTSGGFIQPTGTVSVVGTSGATFYITGVQLEVGSTATSFDVRDAGRELIMCQRYYETGWLFVGGAYPTGSSGATTYGSAVFKVTKRAPPTMSQTASSSSSNVSANSFLGPTTDSVGVAAIIGASIGNYYLVLNWTSSAEL